MPRGPRWILAATLGFGLTACSASELETRGPGSIAPVAIGGTSAGAAAAGTSGTGAFGNPNGLVPPHIVADAGNQPGPIDSGMGLSSRDPISIEQCGADNAAGLSPENLQKLLSGAASADGMRWLYPYEGTVFPRGMLAPLLMWEGGPADAVYVHIKSMAFEYKGCLKPTAEGQLQLNQEVWDKAGQQTYGSTDPYLLELTVLSGGVARGPIREHFTLAQASIKGSIYYNSYSSRLSTLGIGGVVLRIPQGKAAEAFVSTGCNGCHSVSADGSRLQSQFPGLGNQSFAIANGSAANPPGVPAGPRGGFGALYPDGSKYLATSAEIDVARSIMTQGFGAPAAATLYDSATGQVVPSTGIPSGALMPMFSPDGSWLVFNDNAIASAHGLALMKYDVTMHAASEYKQLMQTTGQLRPGWPFVLPDNRAVVFVQTDSRDFSGDGAGVQPVGGLLGGGGGLLGGGGLPGLPGLLSAAGPLSELYIADIASGTVTLLAKAMGYNAPQDVASNTTYLPFGADELHHNYFPTVSPVAAGGYFWVFFDSIRHYGNVGQQRALWASAVDIQADGSYTRDASHPAFYVPGQELGTGNHRAFAALDPCKKDGDTCASGIDCCGGFCYFPKDAATEFGQPLGSCSPPMMNQCAKTDERCTSDSDCCPPMDGQPRNTCIAGFCAFVVTPQ